MPDTHIMVIDDDPETLELLVNFLTQHGYKVSTWRTSFQALEQVQQHHPDVVVLHHQLPVRPNGWELFIVLRALPTTAHIPVILYSAEQMVLQSYGDRIRSMRGDVLEKPIEPEVLLAKIEALTLVSNKR